MKIDVKSKQSSLAGLWIYHKCLQGVYNSINFNTKPKFLKSYTSFLFAFILLLTIACKKEVVMWQQLEEVLPSSSTDIPQQYFSYKLNENALREKLDILNTEDTLVTIRFPNPTGSFEEYTVRRSGIVSEALQIKYPNLAAYNGVSTEDATSRIRFETPDEGFQLMGISSKDTWYIVPIDGEPKAYMVYFRQHFQKENTFWEDKIEK